MRILLLVLCVIQDETLKGNIEALGSDDVAARERAFLELRRMPIEKLSLLEPALDNSDPDLRGRAKELVGTVLAGALGEHLQRFALKPVATREVLEQWAKDGWEPAKVPKGYERLKSPDSFKAPRPGFDYLKAEEVLVQGEAVITHDHIQESVARTSLDSTGNAQWVTAFELTPEGAKRFDDAAARLFAREPPGLIAIIVDGVVFSAPVIQSPAFGGHGQISGAKTESEARRMAALLKGSWLGLSCRVTASGGSAADLEEILKLVKGTPGLGDATVEKSADRECTIRSTIDARQLDLVTLWRELRRKGYSLQPWK
jgi:hypothetical protein